MGVVYQSNIPAGASACKFADEPEQMVWLAEVGGDGGCETVATTGVRTLVQPLMVATT